jgi:hypothetical protein
MSAINPASFASPSLGLQAPSGVGPGAVGATRGAAVERRPQSQDQPPYGGPQASMQNRSFNNALGQSFAGASERGLQSPMGYPAYGYGASAFAAPRGAMSMGTFPPQTQMDPSFSYPQTDFTAIAGRFPTPHGQPHDGSDGWLNSMQSLSLNSR